MIKKRKHFGNQLHEVGGDPVNHFQGRILLPTFYLADGTSADSKVRGHLVLTDSVFFAKLIHIVGIN